ncbi:hypothetical protein B0I08_10677 [Glaciihabitans tibetensis]|uniref:Uncharacterized protein n=1 Tax=Glaciihabitans tibetensis TaxID=1266600 RepID=A0A2T0VBB5_9MICO|nr:hypothetical protein [Glaciihabitans tibetensis]PRY67470.1 hypothetical protein B0I08_10677 [Glaciihabitans tibetensis]
MSKVGFHWTSESLEARLRAQAAIDSAPRSIAGLAAAEHLDLLRTVELVGTARLSPTDAVAQLTRISDKIREASQPVR